MRALFQFVGIQKVLVKMLASIVDTRYDITFILKVG